GDGGGGAGVRRAPAGALARAARHNAHVSPPDRARPRATVRAHTGRPKNASACRRRRQGRQHGGQVAAHGLERGGNTVFLRRILVFHAFVFPVLVFSVFVFHILLGRRQQLRPRQGLDRRRRAARALMDLPAAAERPVKQNQIQGDVALGLSRRVLLLHFEILRREQAVGEDAIIRSGAKLLLHQEIRRNLGGCVRTILKMLRP